MNSPNSLSFYNLVKYQMSSNCGLWALAVFSVVVQKGYVSLGCSFSIYRFNPSKGN